jgi:hypothetical protein
VPVFVCSAIVVLLAGWDSSSNGFMTPSPIVTTPTPSPPSPPAFVVVTTDWQCAMTNPSPPPPCLSWRAHAIVKNNGGAGQALVQFFVVDVTGQTAGVCAAVIPETPPDGVSEASCQSNATGYAASLRLQASIKSV